MHRIKIVSVGKNKEPWLEAAWKEYCKRLQQDTLIESIWCKDAIQLEKKALEEPLAIGLDPQGAQLTSDAFSLWLMQSLQKGSSRLTFIIGDASGLTACLKQQLQLISLSPMTFTHQMCRLILIEQIYRAFSIAKGSAYHK